jgi:hypothetical protein
MKEKILALLVSKFQGVRKDGLNQLATTLALTVTTEEEATTVIEKFTPETVGQFITDWRKEVDAEITKSNQTYRSNLEKTHDITEKKQPSDPDPKTPKTPEGITPESIAAIVQEAIKPFVSEISTFKTNKMLETRKQLLTKELEVLDEGFRAPYITAFDRMNFKDDDDFNAHLAQVKTEVAKTQQSLIDKGLNGQRPKVSFGKPNQDGVSEATQAFLDSQTKKDESLSGKEI